MFIYNYFSKPEDAPMQKDTKTGPPIQRLETQYRGVCQLVNGRADIEFAGAVKNAQVFLQNTSNWDLVRIEDRNTLITGKFTIISNNNESTASVDWLAITDRTLNTRPQRPVAQEEIKEIKKQKPAVSAAQKDLLTELLQRVNTKAIENRSVEEPQPKKKEETDFQKELKKKRKVIMRKITVEEEVIKEPRKKLSISTNRRKIQKEDK
jgi:hypothetical protein